MKTTGDIILFMDDDAMLVPRCIEEHLRSYELESVAVVAGRIVQRGGVSWPAGGPVASINPETGESRGSFDQEYEGPVSYACGCNMSLRRSVLKKTGLFEERFRGNALFEECDFCFRARKRGGEIWYNPRAVMEHRHEPAGGCRSEQGARYLLDRIYNHSLFYFRHIRPFPSAPFLKYMKNLAEFTSRKQGGGRDAVMVSSAVMMMLSAWAAALRPVRAPVLP